MRLLIVSLVVLSITYGSNAGSGSSESMPSSAVESAETPVTNSNEYLHIGIYNYLNKYFVQFSNFNNFFKLCAYRYE